MVDIYQPKVVTMLPESVVVIMVTAPLSLTGELSNPSAVTMLPELAADNMEEELLR